MHKAFLQLAAVLALSLVLLSTNLPSAECFNSTDAVQAALAARIADILPEDEEFMMESETSKRILAGGSTVTPQTLTPVREICKTNPTYEGCDGKQTGIIDRRKCDQENLCGRKGS